MKHDLEHLKKYYKNATKDEVIEDMYLDNCHLVSNWNELKEWVENYLDDARNSLDSYDWGIDDCLDSLLRKMQEIESRK